MFSVFAFSFRCNKMQQNEVKLIDKDRFYSPTNARFSSARAPDFTRLVSKMPAPFRKHAAAFLLLGVG